MATPQSRRVMFRAVGACDQPTHRCPWLLVSPAWLAGLDPQVSRIRLEAAALKIAAAEARALAQKS